MSYPEIPHPGDEIPETAEVWFSNLLASSTIGEKALMAFLDLTQLKTRGRAQYWFNARELKEGRRATYHLSITFPPPQLSNDAFYQASFLVEPNKPLRTQLPETVVTQEEYDWLRQQIAARNEEG